MKLGETFTLTVNMWPAHFTFLKQVCNSFRYPRVPSRWGSCVGSCVNLCALWRPGAPCWLKRTVARQGQRSGQEIIESGGGGETTLPCSFTEWWFPSSRADHQDKTSAADEET